MRQTSGYRLPPKVLQKSHLCQTKTKRREEACLFPVGVTPYRTCQPSELSVPSPLYPWAEGSRSSRPLSIPGPRSSRAVYSMSSSWGLGERNTGRGHVSGRSRLCLLHKHAHHRRPAVMLTVWSIPSIRRFLSQVNTISLQMAGDRLSGSLAARFNHWHDPLVS